jgi:hypothetical protein
MATTVDCKFNALRGLEYTGAMNDMTLQWLQDNGATSPSLTDAWREFLAVHFAPGQRNDDWYAYLDSIAPPDIGRTLPDLESWFWCVNGGVVPAKLVNLITSSQDLTNAAWTNTATTTYDQVGINGDPNTASLSDDPGAGALTNTQDVTVLSNTDTYTFRAFIKKDTDQTRFPALTNSRAGSFSIIQLNTQTGAIITRSNSGTPPAAAVYSWGDWWAVMVPIVNASLTTMPVFVSPADGSVWGVASDAALGSVIVGNTELFHNTVAEVTGTPPVYTI